MNDQSGVIVALPNLETARKVEDIITEAGYRVLAICDSGNDLIRKTMTLEPDIIIVGYKLLDMTILDVYDALIDSCSFLAIVNETHKSYVQEETDIICICHPISKSVLVNSLDIICQSNKKILRLKEKVNKLQTTMDERKLVEKAKGILMEKEKITESEAFRLIQKNSMDTGSRMVDVANKIIAQYKVLKMK